VATGWNLCAAIGYTLVGRLSDIFGRRWFFIGGTLLGLVSSLLGATAQNMKTLIGSSVLAGLAASVQLSFPIVIGELVPNRHRAVANGVILLTAVPFSVFGPVIARSFVLHTAQQWRWSYYLNAIFSGIVVVLYYFFYHPPTYQMLHARRETKIILWKAIDVGGAILFSAGLALFLLGMSWGGQQYPWKSGPVIGSIVGGVVTLVVFVLYGEHLTLHVLLQG
jgi:MFS family permease